MKRRLAERIKTLTFDTKLCYEHRARACSRLLTLHRARPRPRALRDANHRRGGERNVSHRHVLEALRDVYFFAATAE